MYTFYLDYKILGGLKNVDTSNSIIIFDKQIRLFDENLNILEVKEQFE